VSVKEIRKIVLITGTPGVGKTTVSQKLSVILDAHYINITEYIEQEEIETNRDNYRETLIVDPENVLKQIQEKLEKTDGTIIIEGHYAVDVVPNNEVLLVFVLRRDPRELKDILEKRGYKDRKLWENIAAEILDVCLGDALSVITPSKICEIDVSGKTVDSVVEEVIFIINQIENCNYGTVNWLEKLENEGQLEQYLKQIRLTEQT
jgi:adenylate kinase